MTGRTSKPKLSDIPGIGPSIETKLAEVGIKTVAKLAKYDPERLAEKVDGLGLATAKKIVNAAQKLSTIETKTKHKESSMKSKPAPKKKGVKSVKKSPQQEVIDEYVTELHSADQQIALGAVDGLAKIDGLEATNCLIDCLKDCRYMVRLQSALRLGERGDKKAIDSLIDALNDESLFVRQTAAGALESIGGSKASKAIKKAEDEGLLLNELPDGIRL